MTKIPIACTLTPVESRDRVDEWRAFLAERTEARVRDGDTLRVKLRNGDDSLLAAADLSAREKACCAFFTFAIAIDADARWLHISVPPDGSAILDDMASLVPTSD